MKCIPFCSKNNNYYVYSPYRKTIIYTNKQINNLIETKEKTQTNNSLYELYRDNNYFRNLGFDKVFNGRVLPQELKDNITNTAQLTFEVTSKCNLNCDYCSHGKYYTKSFRNNNDFLTFDTAKTILDYMLKLWNSDRNNSYNKYRHIGFYGGEPLLNIRIIKEIIRYIGNQKFQYDNFIYSMTTNGVLLKQHIKFLVKHNFKLLISLDGNEMNNSLRVFHNSTNSYNVIYKNLIYIKNKYPDFFKNNISFNSVLHKKNSVSSIYNYFISTFNKKPNINELSTDGINNEFKNEFWEAHRNIFQSLYQAEDYSFLKKNFYFDLPDHISSKLFVRSYTDIKINKISDLFKNQTLTKNQIPTGSCLPFQRKVFVSAKGYILPCERINHKYKMGEVKNNEVHIDYEKIAESFNKKLDNISKQCRKCYFATNCSQCIYQLEENENQNIKCNGNINELNFKKYLINNINYLENNMRKSLCAIKNTYYE